MHILIATTGVLSAGAAVEFAGRLSSDDGTVTVTTVIEVPRSFLEDVHADGWHPLGQHDTGNGDPGDDTLIDRYVEERGSRLTEPLVSALRAAGITARTTFLEGQNPAKQISVLADEIEADVIVLGATRRIFATSAWESVSSQLIAQTSRPVLVIPSVTRQLPVADTAAE
ncbi:MAG: universal stress protein [Acidimicrobiia bacterium]